LLPGVLSREEVTWLDVGYLVNAFGDDIEKCPRTSQDEAYHISRTKSPFVIAKQHQSQEVRSQRACFPNLRMYLGAS